MCVYDNALKRLISAHSFSKRTKFQSHSWSEIWRQAKMWYIIGGLCYSLYYPVCQAVLHTEKKKQLAS